MRINYILIDLENIQPASLAALDEEHFRIIVFVGSHQTKIGFDVASTMQKLGNRANYIRISGNGPNALDFHIAFYIGQISASDNTAFFHIISKDKGFDPLIEHLKTKKILSCRSENINEIPAVKLLNSKNIKDQLPIIAANLKQRGQSRPRLVKTLKNTIHSLFQKTLTPETLAEIIYLMEQDGIIVVSGDKVSYKFPE